MIRSVKIKPGQTEELEIPPAGRVVEIDDSGCCSLFDQQIIITADQIEEDLT